MKKNKVMRLASVLMVLTLLTTCMLAGTFAKYVTGAEDSKTARVAKFGVEVSVDAGNVFGKNYTGVGSDGISGNEVTEDTSSITVSAQEMVVAPGTKGSMEFSIKGTPETKVGLQISLDNELQNEIKEVVLKAGTYKDLTVDSKITDDTGRFTLDTDYYPVKWTLKNGNEVVKYTPANGEETELQGTTLKAINTYFGTISKEYAANTDLTKIMNADAVAGEYTLSWEWDFDNSSNVTNDKADTLLGHLATVDTKQVAEEKVKWDEDSSDFMAITAENFNLTEAFNFTISVEQVD